MKVYRKRSRQARQKKRERKKGRKKKEKKKKKNVERSSVRATVWRTGRKVFEGRTGRWRDSRAGEGQRKERGRGAEGRDGGQRQAEEVLKAMKGGAAMVAKGIQRGGWTG